MPDPSTRGHTLEVPEGLEVEIYRRAAEPVVGRTIERVEVDERIAGPGVVDSLAMFRGAPVTGVGRVGKLLLVETDVAVIGIHFGMTGRIVVDDVAPIGSLQYGSGRDEPSWDRFRIDLRDGGTVRVNDPRRWAKVTMDPDVSRLGTDWLDLGVDDVRNAVTGRTRSLKAVLLDQHLLAGLGNLCVDEVLWHAELAPKRPAGGLSDDEVERLHLVLVDRLPAMLRLGGSHRGVISPEVRSAMPPCPRDGAPLRREPVAGRTTVWCPRHQT